MTTEIFLENPFAGPARFVLAHRGEAELAPDTFRTFDDEGRGVGVKLIGVRPHPAVLGLLEDESKGIVKFLAGAEPDKFVLARLYRRPEVVRELVTGPRIETVGGDDEVVFLGKFAGAGDLALKTQGRAELARPFLQQQQQRLARDTGEAVAGGDDPFAAIMNGDVVPIGKMLADRLRADRIVRGDIVEGLVGEHDAPAKRVVGPIALEYRHIMRGVAQLDADCGIEPCRAATEASDLHADTVFRTALR